MTNKLTKISLTTLCALLWCINISPAQTRPNIIIVITDDQGYGEVAAHGNEVINTPNLDILHSQSVRLTNFHVDPTCSPTRAALMTGHYSRRTGVWHTISGRSLLRHDQTTVAQVFSMAGYRTAMFGKWHLGDNYPMRPQDVGFQHVVAHKGGGVGNGPDFFDNDYGQYNSNTSKDTYFFNNIPQKYDGYCTDIWFDEAITFIESNKDTNFLVYLATNAPHAPYIVDNSYSDPYVNKGVHEKFYGMITNIDENLGVLKTKLNELNLTDNTILIFMTDNGSSQPAFNANMQGKKGSPYDGGHRVPFFIKWPAGNLMHGFDITHLTAHIDVFPTLLGLADIPKPDDIVFDGMDLSLWLKGSKMAWPDRKLVVESQRIQTPAKYRTFAVMKDQWRLVNNTALFNIDADPGQATNVAGANPSVVDELKAAYEEWWADVSTRDTEFVEIILGSRHENPTRLMSHDWHPDNGELSPWNQNHVKSGAAGTGWYAVNVAQTGTYAIDVRRWPEEKPGPLEFGTEARLKIGNNEWTKTFNHAVDEVVSFEVNLQAGPTRLQTWLDNDHGGYYVNIQRLTGCMDKTYEEYDSTATVNDPANCSTTVSTKKLKRPGPGFTIEAQSIFITENGSHTLWISNISGKLIKQIQGKGRAVYSLASINTPGVYVIRVKTDVGIIQRTIVTIPD